MAVATAIPTNLGCKNVDPFAAAASKSHIINHHYVPAPLPPPRSSSSTAHHPRPDSSFPQCHTTLITRRSRSSLFSLSLSLLSSCTRGKKPFYTITKIYLMLVVYSYVNAIHYGKTWLRLNTINVLYTCSVHGVYVLWMDIIVLLQPVVLSYRYRSICIGIMHILWIYISTYTHMYYIHIISLVNISGKNTTHSLRANHVVVYEYVHIILLTVNTFNRFFTPNEAKNIIYYVKCMWSEMFYFSVNICSGRISVQNMNHVSRLVTSSKTKEYTSKIKQLLDCSNGPTTYYALYGMFKHNFFQFYNF